MEFDFPPEHFLCPISGEVMKEPVTIVTGVTYDRKNIEKWFLSYKKATCPATMQTLSDFNLTPNHTLKRLILSWHKTTVRHQSSSSSESINNEMLELLNAVDSSPFMVTSLKKLRSIVEIGDDNTKTHLIGSNGVQVLLRILLQIQNVNSEYGVSDFVAFRACEESIAVLYQLLPFSDDHEGKLFDLLSKPESVRSMAIVLQRASAETRFHTLSILRNMAMRSTDGDYYSLVILQDDRGGADLFKSLLELVSDEICSKASSAALEFLIEILGASKKSRVRAIEAGAVRVVVELLAESSSRCRCEKVLQLTKLLCECAEGRLALVEHGMGIAAVSEKMLHVSTAATKIAMKIFYLLLCNFHPTERVLEEMLIYGAVKKLLALLHMDGTSSTKDKVLKIFKLHANSWKRYPCFPIHFKHYLNIDHST